MDDEQFTLEISKFNDEWPLLILSGNFCSKNVRLIQRHLDRYFSHNAEIIVYIDLTNVKFMDSPGLGTIVYFHTLFHKKKRQLILINNSNKNTYLSRMFEATNLDKVLNIIQTN